MKGLVELGRFGPMYAVRRFATYRADGRCFEVYSVATDACASLPATKKDAEVYADKLNSSEDAHP